MAEEDTIAACLVDEAALEAIVATGIEPEDFATVKAGLTYAAVRAVQTGGAPVNAVTVAYELAQRGQIQTVTLAWLSRIVDDLPTSVGAEHFARIVLECAQRRRLQSAAAAAHEAADRGALDGEKAVALFAGLSAQPQPGGMQSRAYPKIGAQ